VRKFKGGGWRAIAESIGTGHGIAAVELPRRFKEVWRK